MLDIKELESFITATESESYITPDGKLHRYSSSAASEIISLETKLGCPLFIREGNTSGKLTEAGETLLPMAKKFNHQYHQIIRKMDSFRQETTNRLYIGHLPILKQYHLTSFFTFFNEDYPHCEIHMEEADSRNLLQDLDDGYYDAIIIRKMNLPAAKYGTITLASDEVAAVMSNLHPLSNQNCVQLRDLRYEDFYLDNPHSGSYSFCKQLLIDSHISTENVHIADTETIIQLIQENKGVALLPLSTRNLCRVQNVTALPLSPRGNMPVILVWRKDRTKNPYLQALIEKAEERTKNIPSL